MTFYNEKSIKSVFSCRDQTRSMSPLRQWVVDLKYYTDIKNIVKHLKENESDNYFCKNKEMSYADILEAFKITKEAFQLLILYHFVETFVHAIFYVYNTTEILSRNESRAIPAAAVVVGWILKNFIYETVLSVEFERFYIAVNDATVNSITRMTDKQCSEEEKQMHKNVIRMSQISRKFEVCDLFALDAATPRRLLALIATYTLVVLQFVYVK
ncbi:hypothetical protein ABMA27_010097 [Loxostege sticticalis]|uniref:Gustatory receptor n=1 Tax=Loxostege sticticalis TaxID=481309 RepID=A0ABR3H4J9_LOXSC